MKEEKYSKKVQMPVDVMRCLFLQVPYISLLFPVALRYGKYILLLQAEMCGEAQNKKKLQTKQ
ncbi:MULTISPECIES: hypothetical protein [Prevotella]|uniref:hypothetical protein n=1 Tax=Prevotella intermedia TaxID=28131 RepID=UPI002003EAC6|nr:hypothetical protein [Prevotella intermedia]MCK6144940.1 hypothetical protein [Prevotella intermedia]